MEWMERWKGNYLPPSIFLKFKFLTSNIIILTMGSKVASGFFIESYERFKFKIREFYHTTGIVFFFPGYGRWSLIHSNPKTVFFSENPKDGGKKIQTVFISRTNS